MQGYESKSAATTVFSMREQVKQTISIISIDTSLYQNYISQNACTWKIQLKPRAQINVKKAQQQSRNGALIERTKGKNNLKAGLIEETREKNLSLTMQHQRLGKKRVEFWASYSSLYIITYTKYIQSHRQRGTKQIQSPSLNTLSQGRAYISYMPSLSQIKSTRVLPSNLVRRSAN